MHVAAKVLRKSVSSAVKKLVDEIMPLSCAFCGVESEGDERQVCTGCAADLPWISHACARCASPVPAMLPAGVPCAACQETSWPFETVVVPLAYEFPIDVAIKAWKFQRRLFYRPAFVEILLSVLPRLPPDIDAVLPVPLHRWRFIRRGFNQAFELAKPVADQLRVPVIDCVIRCKATPYQSGLGADERRRNLKSAFRIRRPVNAAHVLLVDDVITTGETCRQVAQQLLGNGAERVSALAVARAS